jgi:hypothetical protein
LPSTVSALQTNASSDILAAAMKSIFIALALAFALTGGMVVAAVLGYFG